MPAIGTFIGVGNKPTVTQANSLGDGTSLRVNFSEPMLNATALGLASSYVISALSTETAFQPTAVTLNTVLNPTSVTLDLTGALVVGLDNFNVTVSTSLSDTIGNTMDPAGNTAIFSGVGPSNGGISITPTPLETYITQYAWSSDAEAPSVALFRRLLASITGNGRQELAYALLSPYANFIKGVHPDIVGFNYGNIGSRTRLRDAVSAVVQVEQRAPQLFREAELLGVADTTVAWLHTAYDVSTADSSVARLRLMTTLLVLAAVATI